MRIYIDESGNFVPSGVGSRVCCVAALVVPETVASDLLSEYADLRASWTSELEIKGSALSDDQTLSALKLLGCFDVIVEIYGLDVGHSPVEQVVQFQQAQGDAIVASLTPEHHESSRRFASNLRAAWLALPPQLASQVFTLVLTIGEVLRNAPNYYAQRTPGELGRFDWIIDPKDVRPTPFEAVWQEAVCPLLQTDSIENPMTRVIKFDYSALDRFEMPIPDYLLPHVPTARPISKGKGGLNLGMILRESVAFSDSRHDQGLQLADIVASAFTKAMNQKLPPEVWRSLGPLMLEKPQRAPTARLIALGDGRPIRVGQYHEYVLKALRNRAKRMFLNR